MPPTKGASVKQVYHQAVTLQQAGRLDEAKARFEAVAKAAPTLAEAPFQLGRIALAQKAPVTARHHLEQAMALKPEEPAIWAELAQALGDTGQTDGALALYDKLIKATPKSLKPRAEKALLLQRTGDFDAAEVEFRKALKRAPKDGELYRLLMATKKMTKGDPLIRAMQQAWADKSVQGRSRVHLGFALAKAMEDIGDHGRVFPYLRAANAGQRATTPFDISARRAEVAGLIEAFRGADFQPITDAPDGMHPIFVTGLPRSGTTLAEQIISAHPQVTSGGEMTHALALAYQRIGTPGAFRPFQTISDAGLRGYAQDYEAAVRQRHSFDRVITDKSIQSHLILGMLVKAMPGAKVIVVRRDPRDIALSIYKNVFADGTHGYSNDLEDIAAYIATFEHMIDFWTEALPDRFTTVTYEDLVADPETQSRRLVAAVGLDWDPACLNFHANTARVATLSLAQVRQPIHARSAKGWEKYAEDLRPLTEALEREGVLRDGS